MRMIPPIRSVFPVAAACALLLSACAADPGEERLEGGQAPPAAAEVAPEAENRSLTSQLERLTEELAAGMAGDPDRLLSAEAITDGLMEARRPVDWLETGYDVEARLRQLQALADRVVARMRRGAALADVEDDVESMRASAADLRAQLAAGGGGPAPPSLDSLLAQDPLRDARVRSSGQGAATEEEDDPEPSTGAPLGQPIPDGP